jgi:hypothetical protein
MSSAASSSAHRIDRALEGALLDALEEVGEFFVGGQRGVRLRPVRRARIMSSHRRRGHAEETGLQTVHNAASHNALGPEARPSDPDGGFLTAQDSESASRGRVERGTDGFSSEKFTKVRTWTCLPRKSSVPQSAQAFFFLLLPRRAQRLGNPRPLPAGRGVKYLWGYPGGAVLYIYDALYKQDSIEHVLVRHEQAAVHAADGYARATGDVGVALVTSGPGVTNAVTGIATAYMDSIPMVIITGQVPTPAIGLDAFQECDTVGITRPVVKHNFLVKDVRDLALTMKKAFHIARTGRPGPVVVDIPKDVSLKTAPSTTPKRWRCARTTRCARATAARSARPCSCCCRPSAPTSTPAAA